MGISGWGRWATVTGAGLLGVIDLQFERKGWYSKSGNRNRFLNRYKALKEQQQLVKEQSDTNENGVRYPSWTGKAKPKESSHSSDTSVVCGAPLTAASNGSLLLGGSDSDRRRLKHHRRLATLKTLLETIRRADANRDQ